MKVLEFHQLHHGDPDNRLHDPCNWLHDRRSIAYAYAVTLAHVPTTLAHVSTTLAHVPTALAHVPTTLAHVPTTLAQVPTPKQLPLSVPDLSLVTERGLRLLGVDTPRVLGQIFVKMKKKKGR